MRALAVGARAQQQEQLVAVRELAGMQLVQLVAAQRAVEFGAVLQDYPGVLVG